MKDDIEHKKYKKKQKHLLKQLQLVEQESQDNKVTNTLVNVSSSDGWEAVDMKKRLHPISHYINNREEMIRQVFDVIQGERLKRLIPPSLKNMDIDELKADCLIQLVGMSSKRIKAVLEGRELDISSDESDSDVDHNVISANKPNKQDLSLANNKKKLKTKNTRSILGTTASTTVAVSNSNSRRRISEDKCSVVSGDDMLEIGLSSSELGDDFFESNEDSKSTLKPKRKKLKRTHKQEPQSQPLPGVSVKVEINDDSKKTKENVNASETNTDKEGKTLLEILELEMRARAIRALLKHDNSSSSNNELEPSSSSLNSKDQNKQKNSEEDNTTKEDENEADDSVIETILQQPETIDLTTTNDSNDEQTPEITGEDTVMKENNELCDKANKNEADEKKQSLQSMKSNDDGDELKIVDVIPEKSLVNSDVSSSDTSSSNSWAQRWLDKKSKDVKKLVTTSKMCTTIRNKMKQKGNKNLLNKTNENDSQTTDTVTQQKTPACEFEGSIDEYNKLVKTALPQLPPQQSVQSQDSSQSEDKVDKVSTSPQPNTSSVDDSNNTEKDIETIIETTQNENV